MTQKELEQSLSRVFESPNVADSNLEAANVVDVLDKIASSCRYIGRSITPPLSGNDVHGGRVESLTEAVMGMSVSLSHIAESITYLADAISESTKPTE